MNEKKLFLLDALALIYRAYYALIRNPRITSKGRNTNAQFGFTSTLFDLINREKPTHLAVCFDTFAPTERHTEFTDYKANRQETPEDLLEAIPDIKKIIRAFNIPVVEIDGYEADDVIGTLAWQAADNDYKVYMVTPDKDYGQLLIHDCVYIYKPGYQGGDAEVYDDKKICEKWGIENVTQVIDMLGLMGDAVDNIPGIKGVGEKTAAKLLKEYGTLENILANAENIKGALGEKIRAGKEDAILSKKLATIITTVPVSFHEEDFKLKDWNREALEEVFAELEFKTLGKRILGDDFKAFTSAPSGDQLSLFGSNTTIHVQAEVNPDTLQPSTDERSGFIAPENLQSYPHNFQAILTAEELSGLIDVLQQQKQISFDTETTGTDANTAELVGLSFCYQKKEAWYIPCNHSLSKNEILTALRPLFENPEICWIGQNIKYDLLMLRWQGIDVAGKVFDTMLAHYVIEPEGRRGMDLLSAQYLQYEPVGIEELIGKKGKNQRSMKDVDLEQITEYACEDAEVTLRLQETFLPMLSSNDVERVFYEIENPLVKVLTDMEFEGMRIDTAFLNQYSAELEANIRETEQQVFDCCGKTFNLASPKQLGEVLFDHLKLDPKAKKTKTGQYATGEDVLLKLAAQNNVVNDILNFRELTKLKSTYVDALPQMINPKTGRIHTCFSQAVAVTGRLSSTNPNLQNIPIRTARGKEIRKAFIPRDENHILISADYSQIELRIVAAISGDPGMCDAFKNNIDIHTATAAKVYNVDVDSVTKEMRYKAKSVNFGIIYGQGAFGLAENLNISRTEAKEIIDNYKMQFKGIPKYMDEQINHAKAKGYVTTLMGRKRWLKDIHSANFTVRGFAERNAINSPIQGSAADMIKLAMIAIHREIRKRKLSSRMVLQVHDELVFDAVKTEAEELKDLIITAMQNALPLPNGVPVVAEVGEGTNWLEAH